MKAEDKSKGNWLRFVNCSLVKDQQNIRAVQFYGAIYYETCVEIDENVELLIWYGDDYAGELGLLSTNRDDVSAVTRALPSTDTG